MSWIGDWLCRRGWHKFKDYVGIDYGVNAIVTVTGQCCARCKHVIIIGVEEQSFEELHRLMTELRKKDEEKMEQMRAIAKAQIDPVLQKITGDPKSEVIFKDVFPTTKELFDLPLEQQPNTVYGTMFRDPKLPPDYTNYVRSNDRPAPVAPCCRKHEEGEMLFTDPFTYSRHTKGCILKEVGYLIEHFNPSAIHPSGLTYAGRIDQLNKLIGGQTREGLIKSATTSGDNWTEVP